MRHALLLTLMLCVWTGAYAAQGGARECDEPVLTAPGGEDLFIRCARDATLRYLDRRAAILDGYRRIGGDFPSMGEHWINLSLLFDTKFDAQRPEVLNYVEISGEPRLLGVAYALPLLAGESSPEWPAKGAWHEHYRTLHDETISPEHHLSVQNPDRARMAMLHAWIWVDNPDGTFAADNWAIPYLRLDIVPPLNGAHKDAAQALSLVTGGSVHFLAQAEAEQALSSDEKQRIEAAFRLARAEVERLIGVRSSPKLTVAEVTRLSEIWTELRNTIESSTSATGSARPCDPTPDPC